MKQGNLNRHKRPELRSKTDTPTVTLMKPTKNGYAIYIGRLATESTHPYGGQAKWTYLKTIELEEPR